jgi:hypothetical protein
MVKIEAIILQKIVEELVWWHVKSVLIEHCK